MVTMHVSRLDEFMGDYDFVERHEVLVAADTSAAWRAVKEVDLANSRLILVLLALRALPRLVRGKLPRRRRLGFEQILSEGFVLLDERATEEIILGIVGRFWKPTGGIVRINSDEFTKPGDPGTAKAVWNFVVVPHAGRTRVTTETRIKATDEAARRSFGRYWKVVGPFSGLIRVLTLRLIRKAAEDS